MSNKKVIERGKETEIKKKKCRNCQNLNLGAETAFPGAAKFENSYWHFSFFARNPYLVTYWLRNWHKHYSLDYPILSSKFQVCTFRRFKVQAISSSGCGICKFAQK